MAHLQDKIQHIQNICIRYIFNCKRRDHVDYPSLMKKLGWFKMSDRRMSHGLTQMYKILKGNAPNYFKNSITLTSELYEPRTRSQMRDTIWISKDYRTKIRRNSFMFAMSTKYNTLPEEITKSESVYTFKSKLKKHII